MFLRAVARPVTPRACLTRHPGRAELAQGSESRFIQALFTLIKVNNKGLTERNVS